MVFGDFIEVEKLEGGPNPSPDPCSELFALVHHYSTAILPTSHLCPFMRAAC